MIELFRHYNDGPLYPVIATGCLSRSTCLYLLTLEGIRASGLLSTEVKVNKNVLTGEIFKDAVPHMVK